VDSAGVFRTGSQFYQSGVFYLRESNTSGYADLVIPVGNGAPNPRPVAGDWTANGVDTIGTYGLNAYFMLCTRNAAFPCTYNSNIITLTLGLPGDAPLAGRWHLGTNASGVGAFRPSNGLIYLKNDLTTGMADYTVILGIPGDIALAGDWTGKGYDSLGVYRPTLTTFFLSDSTVNGPIFGDDHVLVFGTSTDLPVVGDWTAQGRDSVGVFRPSNGTFFLKNTLVVGDPDVTFVFGIPGDQPVSGHWNLVYPPHPNGPPPSSNLVSVTPVPTQPGPTAGPGD
jgi:hypothetical protein